MVYHGFHSGTHKVATLSYLSISSLDSCQNSRNRAAFGTRPAFHSLETVSGPYSNVKVDGGIMKYLLPDIEQSLVNSDDIWLPHLVISNSRV